MRGSWERGEIEHCTSDGKSICEALAGKHEQHVQFLKWRRAEGNGLSHVVTQSAAHQLFDPMTWLVWYCIVIFGSTSSLLSCTWLLWSLCKSHNKKCLLPRQLWYIAMADVLLCFGMLAGVFCTSGEPFIDPKHIVPEWVWNVISVALLLSTLMELHMAAGFAALYCRMRCLMKCLVVSVWLPWVLGVVAAVFLLRAELTEAVECVCPLGLDAHFRFLPVCGCTGLEVSHAFPGPLVQYAVALFLELLPHPGPRRGG